MAALVRDYKSIRRDLEIGTTVPSCPSKFAPFILQNHQLAISRYLREHDSLLLWHGLGSGKTITSIATAFESSNTAKNTVIVACPASLMDNYQEELEEYKDKILPFKTMAHPGMAIDIANKFIQEFKTQSARGLPEPPWFKKFIIDLIGKIGKTGDITKFSASNIRTIIASNDKPAYDGSLVGGKKTKRTRNKTKNKTKGGYKKDMPVKIEAARNIRFTFKSTNGTLNTDGFGDLSDTYLIVIDESQLLLSQLRLDYSDDDLSDSGLDLTQLIPMDVFDTYIGAKYGSLGVENKRAHTIYRELLTRPPHTKLALLSATPIIKNKFEIAIFVNLLSRKSLMPINTVAFENNYGIPRLIGGDYEFNMPSDARHMQILANIYSPIKNQDEFKDCCKQAEVSYFGNIAEMLPALRLLPANKHVFNNDGIPFLNILECPLDKTQALYLKYLQFVSDLHGGFGKFKPDFYDCAFPLDSPADRGRPLPSRFRKKTDDDMAGLFAEATGRAEEIGPLIGKYLYTIQNYLDEASSVLTLSAIKSASKVQERPKPDPTVVGKLTPITLSTFGKNSKISKLLANILTSPEESRHVIYVTSRYASVVIGRFLETLNYIELKTPDQLGIGVGAASKPITNKLYAFLRGQSEDNIYDPSQKMLRYTNDEGNAVEKGPLIQLFNSETLPQFKILIINNCVAEGITLKRVDFIHVMSIPYDIAKLQQIVARVYRNCVHPPGGSITPFIYITTNSNDDLLTEADYDSLHKDNVEWQTYARSRRLERDYEINKFVEKVRENDNLLPYYRLIKECAIENL
uniref:Helicase ATP-binding domain-containing protein n=1 Tax=viral metagenome TaxID=1070528 RepID=A0A6C0I003_9ZZZZ